MATSSSDAFYESFLGDVCKDCGVNPVINTTKGVEVTLRTNANGSYLFLLNHSGEDKTVTFDIKNYSKGRDLLSNDIIGMGSTITIKKADIKIIQVY
jgi:beta-galactosidase